ncbi:methyl-accepting chemotaxis protein [Calothrix sp. PCC 6303]|uniref:methyl-accepting chemotaxis protein n=1 Tax=Calothrix sp. PCC 6303 TaxID=1170562 RepID=UPI0002A031B3|nr:methyl-accepting chemotaxis protein [Calothrix sp. PCC 6303]AFY99605.1 methyl-accepting chemotaxis sensory transducer with GAF sensor [Calothrix sp. PCC 6303]
MNKNFLTKHLSNESHPESSSHQLLTSSNQGYLLKPKLTLWQHFSNLSISRKQIVALVASEIISIIGVTVVSRLLITSNLQVISAEQAKSELAVIDMAYNIKVNQMGFGFRGQSDNTAIIRATANSFRGQSLSPELKAQVKQILVNEITARKIEYATLVGRDLKIIVNANAERQGEVFNPGGLVSEVFNFPKQIKASRIVQWSELSKELPPLPQNFRNQDALIRYTVTPVKDPETNIVIGALVSGDIVNQKDTINQTALDATGGGYSAIYYQKPNGEFILSTSLASASSQSFRNLQLPKAGETLLKEAVLSGNNIPTARMTIGNEAYVVAAKAVPNKILQADDESTVSYNKQPVAILVRGTPEIAINQLLNNSSWIQLLTIVIALLIISIWTVILRKTIILPITELQKTAFKYFTGDRTARAEVFAEDEIGELAITFNRLTDKITQQVKQQEDQVKIAQLVHEVTDRYRVSLNPQYILDSAIISIKSAIQADRVLVYRLDQNWNGQIVAESVNPDFPIAVGTEIIDIVFVKNYIDQYQNNSVQAIANVDDHNFSSSHLELLHRLGIKASLIAPILINKKLYGLLIAHQCSETREWQNLEINLLKQVAIPIGYALEQTSLNQRIDHASSLAELVSGEKRQQQEVLQQQISRLIQDISSVSQGNLTVKAEVVSGQIGLIAENFNLVVDNLKKTITEVQSSSCQINTIVRENENVIYELSAQTQKQTSALQNVLEKVQPIISSLQATSASNNQAREVTRTSFNNAQQSLTVIDSATQNISTLRSTIDEMKKRVKKLGESSLQIDNIIDLVSEIGTQASLLAVNTELQASRRNQDSSFLLIATNLGDLAIRCAAITQEIEAIVNTNQQETREIIQVMDLVTSQVVKETNITENTKASLNETLIALKQINQLVNSIFEGTTFQLETSQSIQEMIQEIDQVSEVSNDFSQQVFQSWQKALNIAQELQINLDKLKVNETGNS